MDSVAAAAEAAAMPPPAPPAAAADAAAPPADAAPPPAAAATTAPPPAPPAATAASSSSHHAFLAKLQQPAAASLSRALKSFVRHASADKARSVAQLAELTQTFFRDTEEAIAGHALWRDEPPEALERACDAVEKVVMSRLHDRVFLADAAERAADAALGERLGFLQFVDADHLGIPPAVRDAHSWANAQREICKMALYRTPRDKLVCVLNCCKLINSSIARASAGEHGADEFFPVRIAAAQFFGAQFFGAQFV